MDTVLVTGGTGMIGNALTKALLEKNYKVIILSRDPGKQRSDNPNLRYARWNVKEQTIDANALTAADHIIHLAGAGVADKRWSKKRKKEIVDSRVKSGELLVKYLTQVPNKIKTVIGILGIGFYGPDVSGKPFTESDPPANDFLGETCRIWEESLKPVELLGKRLVQFRTGAVLSNAGGAIKEFKKPLLFGFATILGSGKQIISWIHIDDIARLLILAIENTEMKGAYNAVAPNPVTNKELIRELAKATKRFYIPFYVPVFVLKMVFGELSTEVLKSATVSSKKIEAAGFSFDYPTIQSATQKLAAS
jgi:uncharacterized protein (TIGR01777 family)